MKMVKAKVCPNLNNVVKSTMTKVILKVSTMVYQLKNNFPNFLWPFLFCFLISIPSSLSIHSKSRESGGVVLSEYHNKEFMCLVNTLYAEARSEPEEGIRAVMSVIYNRKKAKGYPNIFCGVILQDKQFSAFNSDKSLATKPLKPIRELDKEAYRKVSSVAQEAAQGAFKPVLDEDVLHYAKTSVRNHWTKRMKVVKIVSSHKFMKVNTSGEDATKKEI